MLRMKECALMTSPPWQVRLKSPVLSLFLCNSPTHEARCELAKLIL